MDKWGLGIGDWGLEGIGDWGLGPIPNPQSPIPNPQRNKISNSNNIIIKILLNKYSIKKSNYLINTIFWNIKTLFKEKNVNFKTRILFIFY